MQKQNPENPSVERLAGTFEDLPVLSPVSLALALNRDLSYYLFITPPFCSKYLLPSRLLLPTAASVVHLRVLLTGVTQTWLRGS